MLENDTSVTPERVVWGVRTLKAMSFHKEHAFMVAEVPLLRETSVNDITEMGHLSDRIH